MAFTFKSYSNMCCFYNLSKKFQKQFLFMAANNKNAKFIYISKKKNKLKASRDDPIKKRTQHTLDAKEEPVPF